MDSASSLPWVKSRLSSLPAFRRSLSPSSLGGDGQTCLLKHALSALDASFMMYAPPTFFSSWGTVYHALKEKAFTREQYDLTLREQLAAEDAQNSMDWLRQRLVPLADIPFVRNKIANHRKRTYDKLPISLPNYQGEDRPVMPERNFTYLREKFLPEKGMTSALPFRGRIDCLVRYADGTYEIRDYKTGSIYETKTKVVKSAYVRQLHAYALLTREAYGRLPKRMMLIDELDNAECVEFSNEVAVDVISSADAILASIEDALRCFISGGALPEYCTPSPAACQFCQVKPYCPVYWQPSGLTLVGEYTADLRGAVSSSFTGYSDVGGRADVKLCVGEGRFVSLLMTRESVAIHPVLADWVAGRVAQGATIYVLSAARTPSPTQIKVRDDTVVCSDGY